MKKQPEVSEATKQALIDAFCLLNRDMPIGKITIQAITRKAGYNRCTFYQYFKDVYDLLDHIESIVISHVKENFQKNITQQDFSRTFFDAFTRIQQERSPYFTMLLRPANRTHFTERLTEEVLPIFMERFNLPKEHPHSEYLASMYLATVITAIGHWVNHNRSLPLEDLSKMLGNVLTQGVMTEIGKCRQ